MFQEFNDIKTNFLLHIITKNLLTIDNSITITFLTEKLHQIHYFISKHNNNNKELPTIKIYK